MIPSFATSPFFHKASQKESEFNKVKSISTEWKKHKCCPWLKEKAEKLLNLIQQYEKAKGCKKRKEIKKAFKHLGSCAKEIKKIESYHALWLKFFPKTDPEEFYTHADQIEFLFRTRLIYSIKGQETTSRNPSLIQQHQLQYTDKDVKIRLHCENEKGPQWISISELMDKSKFHYDADKACLVDNEGNSWNYFKDGLQKVDRWEGSDFIPVAKISKEEQSVLLEHAKKFWNDPSASVYEASRVSKSTEQDTCVVQLFMCPRGVLKKPSLANVPLHAAIRLVDNEGNVYSTGFGSTIEEDKFNKGQSNFLATINGMPTLMDYEETRPDDGRVTVSLSISRDELDKIVNKLSEYRQNTIRFNILRQNCTRLAINVLHEAGVDVSNRANVVGMYIDQSLPNPIHEGLRKINRVYESIVPSFVRQVVRYLMMPITFIATLIYIGVSRLLLWALGSRKGSPENAQPSPNAKPNKVADQELLQFKNASKTIDYFDDPLRIYHSTPLLRWMLAQSSTTVAEYKEVPDMRLHPDQHSQEKLERLRKIYHVHADELSKTDQPDHQSKDKESIPISTKSPIFQHAPRRSLPRLAGNGLATTRT